MRSLSSRLSILALVPFVALVALSPARALAEEAPPPTLDGDEIEAESPSPSPSSSSSPSSSTSIVVPAAVGGALVLAGWITTFIAVSTSTPPRHCTPVGYEPGYEYVCDRPSSSGEVGLGLIPIAGPFLVAGSGHPDAALYVLTGLAQIAGVLTIAIGVPIGFAQHHRAARTRLTVAQGSVVLGIEGSF